MEMQTAPSKNLTPANAVNHRQELRPMPLRVATKQYERLDQARARTGLSIQEHARRALDLYLAVIEREAIDLGLMPERANPAPQAPAASPSVAPNQTAMNANASGAAAVGRSKPLRDRPRVAKR